MIIYILLSCMALTSACFALAPLWRQNDKKLCIVIALLFLIITNGFYSIIGRPFLPARLEAREERMRGLAFHLQELAQKTKERPDSAEAWAALGAAFLEAEQYDAGVRAFKQAVLLSGGDPALILAFAKAQILAADGNVTEDAARALHMVLKLEPENQEAQALLAAPK